MKTKYWIFLFTSLAVLALIIHLFLFQGGSEEAIVARIYQDGNLKESVSLSDISAPYTLTFTSPAGGENIVLIENGRISMQFATCPDQICVQQGVVSRGGIPIVCLPHRLVIELFDTAMQVDTVGR